jgi:hypothetical protein
MEQQTHNKLNYLDLTIVTNNNELNFEIYRKPTLTDLILHNTSCHPYEHKKSAINYLYNRKNTYKINKENQIKEGDIITQILKNNEYPPPYTDITKKQLQITPYRKKNGLLSHTSDPASEQSPRHSGTPT